jgi:hypothetical protein
VQFRAQLLPQAVIQVLVHDLNLLTRSTKINKGLANSIDQINKGLLIPACMHACMHALDTWIPRWQRDEASTVETLVASPRRSTSLVPRGIMWRTAATAKLVPSTILVFRFGFLITYSSPLLFSSLFCKGKFFLS